MSKKRKDSSWHSLLRMFHTAKQKRMSGKVDVRIELRQWVLWLILAAALACMWLLIVMDQSPSTVDVGEPVNGQAEEEWEEAEEQPCGDSDGAAPEPEGGEEPSPFPVRINRAGVEELQELPGIGPAKAQAIVQHRMLHGLFETKEELREVKGIGPKTMENLLELITVD